MVQILPPTEPIRNAVMDNMDALIKTISSDFSNRASDETKLADMMPVIHSIDYCIKNVKEWMKPTKRKVSPLFQPAGARVEYQPLGVVGIIAPWNYTVNLSLGPLVAALAAGNRAMIKMSEFTPATSLFIEELMRDTFPEDLVVSRRYLQIGNAVPPPLVSLLGRAIQKKFAQDEVI